MATPLITLADFEARIGRTLTGTEATQATVLIDDASALVRDVAADDFLNDDTGVLEVPASVVPVVVAMVRRAIENPRGLTGEQLGDYQWQASGNTMNGIFATRKEKMVIRRAVRKLGVGTVQLEGDLPLRTPTLFEELFLQSLDETP